MDLSQRIDRQWEAFDLRRPTKLSREQLRSLDLFHDTFSRRLSSGIGRLARSSASAEMVRISQLSWEGYLRTLPAVTTLVTAQRVNTCAGSPSERVSVDMTFATGAVTPTAHTGATSQEPGARSQRWQS